MRVSFDWSLSYLSGLIQASIEQAEVGEIVIIHPEIAKALSAHRVIWIRLAEEHQVRLVFGHSFE